MTWTAQLDITNHTSYNITVTRNNTGDLTTIAANSTWTWSTAEVNNTLALKFWQTPNVWYMQGSVAFGPEAGVYMDRGWQAADDQTIALTGTVNTTDYHQTSNGGATVVPWNGFEGGGTITMQFDPQVPG
jgi:hypothetical protein